MGYDIEICNIYEHADEKIKIWSDTDPNVQEIPPDGKPFKFPLQANTKKVSMKGKSKDGTTIQFLQAITHEWEIISPVKNTYFGKNYLLIPKNKVGNWDVNIFLKQMRSGKSPNQQENITIGPDIGPHGTGKSH